MPQNCPLPAVFPTFALDNHIWLFGWPVECVPHFLGDPLFDGDKMVKREWEHLWQVGIVNGGAQSSARVMTSHTKCHCVTWLIC